MSNPSSPLKPTALAFNNSGRASPFRRPESSLGRSPSTMRAATPQGSPLKQSTPHTPPSKLAPSTSHTPLRPFSPAASEDKSWLKTRGTTATATPPASPERSPNPQGSGVNKYGSSLSSSANSLSATRSSYESPSSVTTTTTTTTTRPLFARTASNATAKPPRTTTSDPLSSIPPQHLHTMRESFAVLDRNNTGTITPSDVTQQLSELGLDTSSTSLSSFFPRDSSENGRQSINLATYLQLLSSDLAHLSRQDELMAAFSAFDEDDSGQIDVAELRDAIMHTLPEPGSGDRQLGEREVDRVLEGFIGRRAFKRGALGNGGGLGAKKDVFRYGDFVAGIWGGNGEVQAQQLDA